MYGSKLELFKEARLLGVTLDSKLTRKPHITRITRYVSTRGGVLEYVPWPRGHILKSLASKPQVLENCPVLGSRTGLFFVPLKLCIIIIIHGQRCKRICYC